MKLPIEDPVLIFTSAMILFFIAPLIMKKFKIPGIIGPILAGIIVGPYGLQILERDQTIELLGNIGLLFIIFIAGLELDIDGFKKYRNRSLLFGSLSFNIPLILGTVVGVVLGYNLTGSILLGSIIGSHTLLAYPIASAMGISKNKAVTTAVGGTLLTDTFALLILAIVTGSTEGQLTLQFWLTMLLSLVGFALLIMLGVPKLSKWYFRNSENEGITTFSYVMVILFFSSSLAILIGMQPLIGAFLAGLALNRFVLDYGTLMNRIRFLGNAIFIPFFLLSVGMLMDLSVLFNNPKAWVVTAAIVGSVFIGKAVAPFIVSKVYGYSPEERNVMIGLTTPQAAATLASTLVGYRVGLLDQMTVNAVIIMILLTCFFGSYVVEKYGRQVALNEERQPSIIGQDINPERILIPIANLNTMESLIDLASMIRESNTYEEALHPLTVVQKDINAARDEVANAEKMLGHALMYASGAEIPILPMTRVDQNVSNGIIRAMAERRIDTVVIGWNAERKFNQVFGNVIDRVVEQTTQSILVTKLDHPLEITRRIVLIIPRGADRKGGFSKAIEKVKTLAVRLSASLLVLVIEDAKSIYEDHMNKIKPDPPVETREIEDWKTLQETYVYNLKDDDIVVIMSARKGTIAWHPQLEELPKSLAKVKPKSFIVYYPEEM
ncbi:cation:proton antiporter [Marinilactibacillus sp. Marseille-P9653]|uniref:cation:proton antiporter n=1 Tax=Marinilactibacillus sp. Marseille-P9653 TaxID=2866583 RepID=UPI001CE4637C|nr:cation:proton antiporter [Marinilactibacillus sp. Marseille-P9653]